MCFNDGPLIEPSSSHVNDSYGRNAWPFYGAFAGAVVNYRRGQYDRVHRRLDERESTPHVEARAESYRLRSAAQQEFFRVQLVSDDADLTALAERALDLAEQIHDADNKQQVKEYGDRAKQALGEFVALASAKLQA